MGGMKDSNLEQNQTPEAPLEPEDHQSIEHTQPTQLEAGAEKGASEPAAEVEHAASDLEVTRAIPVAAPDLAEAEAELSATLPGVPLTKGYEDTQAFEREQASAAAASQPASPPSSPPPPAKPGNGRPKGRPRGLPWFFYPLAGLAILLLVLLVSGFGGYTSGIGMRKSAEKTQVAGAVAEQYALGIQDMEQGLYGRARQRFEYVIQLDPNYPGVTEKLAQVLLELNTTATPTLLPTATLTPTPDDRDSQQRFDQAQQALAANDWTATVDTLLILRKLDPTYRAVEIDGLLFLALRNRGRDKILKSSDLEGGIYDLTLASQFGPLDAEAQGLLSWSSLYITGASFWGIDWEQAVNYFSQVAPNLPNLMDGSKMTATERLRQALFEYGNSLAQRGQYCAAVRAYQQSYEISPDPAVQQAGELAAQQCAGAGDQPAGTPKPKKPKPTKSP
ncbi:MAG: hypothetical protein B6D39_03110 [Anaerolineae bacterium UTCFX2]|jgi:tetratricopeptide (TPR) repeat protein|nr:MAG: hypothetical protein B6D39_03110 [Anaerolineae bacterium UTCFX2]